MAKKIEKQQFTTKLPPKLIKEFDKAIKTMDIYKVDAVAEALEMWIASKIPPATKIQGAK